jgi:hypothetical protein
VPTESTAEKWQEYARERHEHAEGHQGSDDPEAQPLQPPSVSNQTWPPITQSCEIILIQASYGEDEVRSQAQGSDTATVSPDPHQVKTESGVPGLFTFFYDVTFTGVETLPMFDFPVNTMRTLQAKATFSVDATVAAERRSSWCARRTHNSIRRSTRTHPGSAAS